MLFLFSDFFVKPTNQNITDHQSQNPTKHGDNSALFKISENHDTPHHFTYLYGSIVFLFFEDFNILTKKNPVTRTGLCCYVFLDFWCLAILFRW